MNHRKLCIGLDSFGCGHGMSGFGSYLLEFVRNIPQGDFEFCIFGHELDKYTYSSTSSNITFKGINIKDNSTSESLWHKTKLNSFIRKNHFDAMLYTTGFRLLPLSFIVPSFLIVNDVPSNSSFISNLYTRHIIGKVRGIIAPSKYVKNELLNFGVPSHKINIIHSGVNQKIFKPMVQDTEIVLIQPFSIKRPYIIYASSLNSTRKAHIELINAFNIFKEKTSYPHKLVIAGSWGDAANKIRSSVLTSKYSQDILLTGYFPHESLSKLYANAELAIFPSRHEGSAVSVLEAMASGVPTACSQEGALKEIAEDASIYFDSTSPDDIARAIECLIKEEKNEKMRENLVEKGLLCAQKYSWAESIKNTVEYIISKL